MWCVYTFKFLQELKNDFSMLAPFQNFNIWITQRTVYLKTIARFEPRNQLEFSFYHFVEFGKNYEVLCAHPGETYQYFLYEVLNLTNLLIKTILYKKGHIN